MVSFLSVWLHVKHMQRCGTFFKITQQLKKNLLIGPQALAVGRLNSKTQSTRRRNMLKQLQNWRINRTKDSCHLYQLEFFRNFCRHKDEKITKNTLCIWFCMWILVNQVICYAVSIFLWKNFPNAIQIRMSRLYWKHPLRIQSECFRYSEHKLFHVCWKLENS